ncbi:restriction endonuclease subunit S [Flavobacterium sp. 2]|uniref:restriction endonuclease subunit S n=1 Tax=Flavobacterium sp. 2 TaxID=308053 RepID=UPI003CF80E14
MSYLEKLLDGVNIEWKPLGEFADYEQPTKYLVESNNYNNDFTTPVLTAGKTFVLGYTDETEGIYKASENPVIIFDDFTTANKWVDFDFKAKSSAMKMITSKNESKASLKYIYYWMNTLPSDLVDGDHKRQWISNYANKLIPIPCPDNPKKSLEIQQKIVAILDTFSELTARKTQYSYYREKLYTFDENKVEWKTLKDLTSLITKGTTPKKYIDTGIAFIKTEAFDGSNINSKKLSFIDEDTHNKELKRSILKHNDILITIAGATIGKCAIVPKEILPANTNQALAIIRLNDDVNLKYVFHLMKSNHMTKYIELNIKGSAQPNLNLQQLNNFSIPYPSPEEQERIVSILEKFDTLTNSISEGLPKEIELRKKQYEYYRDLLLTFPQDNLVD